ncbi:MAG: substrate-binding domain-containing protein, partial [Myxococcota bacterium]
SLLIGFLGSLAFACEQPSHVQYPPEGECTSVPNRPSSLIVAGSGSNLALMQRLVERYQQKQPKADIWLPGSIGTRGAVRAVKDGAVDIGLASRPLHRDEFGGSGLSVIPLARSRVVLAAHPSVDSGVSLTRSELVSLYTGTPEPRWSDGRPVLLLLREAGDSSNLAIRQVDPQLAQTMAKARIAERGAVMRTDQAMRDALLNLPGACGFIDEGIIKLRQLPLVVVPIRGMKGELIKELTLLTRQNSSPEVLRFVAFVQAEAQDDIFEQGGYQRGPQAP